MAGMCVPSAPTSTDTHWVRFLHSNVSQVDERATRMQMNIPCERGPEGRHYFQSFLIEKERSAFTKYNPLVHPPADNAALAPIRDEVLLIDPCSGNLSAEAEVDLGTEGRQPFLVIPYIPSGLFVAPDSRKRPQTAPVRPSEGTCDLSVIQSWNSRRIPDAALRASLGGWTSHQNVKPVPLYVQCRPTLKSFGYFTKGEDSVDDPSGLGLWIEKAARHYMYTSSAQKSYEEISWDSKLPARLKPPTTTLEKMADPVSQHCTEKRYHSKPELWQSIGSHWNRYQLRGRNEVLKPITFSSPCPKSGQIPLYSGMVGSENMDNVDDTGCDFYPLTMQRTTLPQYTPTAHRPTIPGYTGKAHFENAWSSVLIPPLPPSSAPG
ncbi:hypothetical protein UPYG_G00321400 [Umbra pygmaea]|uniref:Spermatogenesis-associated protein 48 n=1 Tax=Umbra pygmaea TaxID=75934 RepID=A0ABD0WFN2_UMBPY